MNASRARVLADMRLMLDWLEAHPDVPLPQYVGHISYYPQHNGIEGDAAGIPRLQEIAQAMGVKVTNGLGDPVTDETPHHIAAMHFGATDQYQAIYGTDKAMREDEESKAAKAVSS